MKLMLDAGHGGNDPGAIAGEHEEEDLTLDIVLKLVDFCHAQHPGWTIILTRTTDLYFSPGARQRMMMRLLPDAFVSVHCNAAENNNASGTETIYRDDLDLELANPIQFELVEALKLRDRGVKQDETDLGRKLSVLSSPGVPSVIVEPGFITCTQDRLKLYQTENVAQAILRGIESWASEKGIV